MRPPHQSPLPFVVSRADVYGASCHASSRRAVMRSTPSSTHAFSFRRAVYHCSSLCRSSRTQLFDSTWWFQRAASGWPT